ncbi:juvenile hormone epoxide hydrolase 1-like [Temnothorax nylanderi]|uniref:juvenile hormone epoxide hydrolase 1-like n=1 Tax=Temnothorax nylanderi TaxID=102681 RepID=UPI003A87145F
MGYFARPITPIVLCTVACSTIVYSLVKYVSYLMTPSPKMLEKCWNPDKESTEENTPNSITSFNINFPSELVEDLKIRLKNTRRCDNYDTNNGMQKLLDYWADSYNFQRREKYINNYEHFKTNIQGLDIHYVHVKPKLYGEKQVLPLLMLHGWPSSIIEFYKIIPLLTSSIREYDFVFEVVVPSIPGFGFSSAPTISDALSCTHMSVILKNLMLRLGHNKFYIQDSDWGVFISRVMASLFPEHVLGTHSNVRALLDKKFTEPSSSYLTEIMKQVTLSNKLLADTEYFQIHAIKPETIGVGLNDSPAALATYIMEKFLIGTKYSEINDEFLRTYSYNDLIDNLMIYWTSKSITTAMRIYAQQFGELKSEPFKELMILGDVKVPSYFSAFLSKVPRCSVLNRQMQKEIVLAVYANSNNRFPALEEPKLLAENIWMKIDTWYKHFK